MPEAARTTSTRLVLLTLILLPMILVLASPPTSLAQPCTPNSAIITFECNPEDNEPFDDGEMISNQYDVAPWFISFSLPDAPPGTGPQIAMVGPPQTAFQGPNRSDACAGGASQDDMPAPNQSVGCFFLTDDGQNQGPPNAIAYALLISYRFGVRQVSGELLDIQPCCESWRIDALDESMQVLDQLTLSVGDPNTGDGVATSWQFDLDLLPGPPADDIRFLRLEYTGDQNHAIGLAFDNFSFASSPVGLDPTTWGEVKALYR